MSSIAQLILALFNLVIDPLLFFLMVAVFLSIILSWLINFNVINGHNQFVATVWRMANALTEPFLRPIRRFLPPLGGLDLSPLVLLLLIQFVRYGVIPTLITRPLEAMI